MEASDNAYHEETSSLIEPSRASSLVVFGYMVIVKLYRSAIQIRESLDHEDMPWRRSTKKGTYRGEYRQSSL
jgi:hypothetical protein